MGRLLISAIALLVMLSSCVERNIQLNGQAQGTYYYISYYDSQGRVFQQEIDSLLDDYNKSVSTYDTTSIISGFNRNESGIKQDNIFLENLRISREISEATSGAFDPTVAPLVDAWGFGFKEKKNLDSTHIDSLMHLIGMHHIKIESGQAYKTNRDVEINFNAIAQGYSVEMVGDFLESKGIRNYLVDIGGEVSAIGQKPGGKKWVVGIEKPASDKYDKQDVQVYLEVTDMAVATSGNYRKYYEKDGVRYSHTINPQTGRPVSHSLLSATVITDDCAKADAYATAFMVMGTEKALEFVKNNPGKNLEIMLIVSNKDLGFQTIYSPGFKKYLMQ
jgi:thiamine biosynthesis lipoprotein